MGNGARRPIAVNNKKRRIVIHFFRFGQPQEWPSVTSLFCWLLIIAQLTSYYRDWHAPLIVHHHANTFLSPLARSLALYSFLPFSIPRSAFFPFLRLFPFLRWLFTAISTLRTAIRPRSIISFRGVSSTRRREFNGPITMCACFPPRPRRLLNFSTGTE